VGYSYTTVLRKLRVNRQQLLLVLVSLVTVLAGCAGGLGGAPSGSDGGDGGDGGAGDGGDGQFAEREAALRAAGSYTSTWNYTTQGLDAEGDGLTVTHRTDITTNRTHVRYGGVDGEGYEQFRDGATLYSRYGSAEDPYYTVSENGGTLIADTLSYGGIYADGDLEGLERVGTETFDGVAVTRYEADGQSLWWAGSAVVGGGQPEDVNSVEVSYVLLVDGDGLVRSEAWTYTGTTNDGREVHFGWEYSITDVGRTVVEDPAWLADANASSGR
jgi:hypothetical protein